MAQREDPTNNDNYHYYYLFSPYSMLMKQWIYYTDTLTD